VTEQRVQRRLAAILAADVVGYSALMQRAEEATYAEFERLKRELIEPSLSRHEGRLIKTTGDGALVEFASPMAAVRCAVEIQDHLASGGSPFSLRVGINLGDVIVGQGGELYGDGINIAVRLEGIADPGGILISEKVHSEVDGKLDVGFEDRGEQQLKNISKPVRAFAVRAGASSAPTDRLSAAPPLPDKPSIAVLPFENMSGDPEQEYFADGMVEEIITALSRSKSLFVIARHSTFTYKGKAVDIKKVGCELGVRYVLEGSVRKVGNRVRIAGQLIDATTGAHLWADRFDTQLEDIFDLQDQVTSSVIGAIFPQLERAEIERAKRKPTESLQAYDYYLRALSSFYQFTREQNIEALRLSQAVSEIDPEFAAAYAIGAYSYLQRKMFGWTIDAAQEHAEARRLVKRAIELDKDDPTVLARAGQVISELLGEVEEGAALLSRALSLDPNLVIAWYSRGWEHLWLGDVDAALKQFHMAVRLSPLDPLLFFAQTGIAYAHFMAGRYDDGSSWARSAVLQRPNYLTAQFMLAACHAMSGRVEEARVVCARLMQARPTLRISRIIPKIETRFRNAEDVERLSQACRIAGIPE
jgi:TolB-like protein